MTYEELARKIRNMPREAQDCDVTVYDKKLDEFFALTDLIIVTDGENGDGILDLGHPYLAD
jgi:hypothetical protein